jgi:hypothetical protein
MEEKRNMHRISVGKCERWKPLEDLGVDGNIILNGS